MEQQVDVLPGPRGRPLRGVSLRGIHAQGREAAVVYAGGRVAVNLRGVETADVRRGDVLVTTRSRLPTRRVLVEASLLEGAQTLKEGHGLTLHIGTRAVLARVAPLGTKQLVAGETGLLSLSLDVPAVVYPDQRFVLRDAGGAALGTLGGGRILDPHADRGKGAHGRATLLAPRLRSSTTPEERAMDLVVHAGSRGVSATELALRVPMPQALGAFLQSQVDKAQLIKVTATEPRYVSPHVLDDVSARLLELVDAFHQERPLLAGIPAAELLTRVSTPLRPLVAPALAALLAAKRLVQQGELVRTPTHKTSVGDSPTLLRLEETLVGAKLSPPGEEELCATLRMNRAECRDAL
ncbi:MAG: DNA/RNA-binding winged helix domain-containing protein, partial [Candidatus Limnocylindrus sp.]